MIDRDEYAVRVMDLPVSVGGFVTESPDGFLNIYINARHGWRGQRRSFRHELRHAEDDDLRSSEPLDVIEARADGIDLRLSTIPHLMRARDLLPKRLPLSKKAARPEPVTDAVPRSRPSITPRQAAVLLDAIAELDRWYFTTEDYH
jgi:hypothetical protein